jgi:hypothetical protein
MEDNRIFGQMEDDLNILVNVRQPTLFDIEDDFNYLLMEDNLIFFIKEIKQAQMCAEGCEGVFHYSVILI